MIHQLHSLSKPPTVETLKYFKNVVVTGGCGFIGSNLVEFLLASCPDIDSIHVIDNQLCKNHSEPHLVASEKVIYHRADIRNLDELEAIFKAISEPNGVEAIFHLAAEARIQDSLQQPMECFSTNIFGTTNIMEIARMFGAVVVFASTSACLGQPQDFTMSPHTFEAKASDAALLLNPYAYSKRACETICQSYWECFHVKTAILRFYNVYGKNQPKEGAYAPVMVKFLDAVKNNQPLPVTGDGEQKRDFVPVEIVVRSLVSWGLALHNSLVISPPILQPVEVGTGYAWSILNLAKQFDHPIKFLPARPGEMMQTLANNHDLFPHLAGCRPGNCGWGEVTIKDLLKKPQSDASKEVSSIYQRPISDPFDQLYWIPEVWKLPYTEGGRGFVNTYLKDNL